MNIVDITSKIPSCNYAIGRVDKTTGKTYKPEGVTLHITADSVAGNAAGWFENPASGVSSNYIIEKDGTLVICVKPEDKAFHCGVVKSPTAKIYFDKGNVNPNLYMVGIECVSSGEPLTNEQYATLLWVLKDLSMRFQIALDRYHVIGHYELDSITRANDPISSYSVDDVVKKVNYLEWKQVLEKVASNPADWEKAIDAAVTAAKADGSLGDLEIFAFLPQLIEKIYNSR